MSSEETLSSYARDCMGRVGITSIRGLAARTGIAPETARRVLTGTAIPEEETLQKIADHLPASIQKLRRLAGHPQGERSRFVLPAEADQLDDRQRSVVLSVIHALLDASTIGSQRTGNGGNAHAVPQVARLVGRRRDTDGLGSKDQTDHDQ